MQRYRFIGGDYTKIAGELAAYAEKVEKPKEVISALNRALKVTREGRPALLEFITKEELELSRYW